jgi:hypothetical protein
MLVQNSSPSTPYLPDSNSTEFAVLRDDDEEMVPEQELLSSEPYLVMDADDVDDFDLEGLEKEIVDDL